MSIVIDDKEQMTKEYSNEHILSVLYDVRAELQRVVERQGGGMEELTARDWFGYDEALKNVHLAISALEKVNNFPEVKELPCELNTSKKGILKQLSEIKIDGEPDWSQRKGQIL